MNTRWLGTLCIIGGFAYVVMAVYGSITQLPPGKQEQDPVMMFTVALWMLGAICGWLGFILVRGTGNNIVVRFLSFTPIVGLLVAFVYLLYGVATGSTYIVTNPIFSTGVMLSVIGSVFVTIFALATRALAGWHKFAPLFTVLALVLGGLLQGITQDAIWGIPLCIGIAFAILGYVVRTVPPSSRLASTTSVSGRLA